MERLSTVVLTGLLAFLLGLLVGILWTVDIGEYGELDSLVSIDGSICNVYNREYQGQEIGVAICSDKQIRLSEVRQ